MSLNVTGGALEFDAVVNIDQGIANINKLASTWNSIGNKTGKNQFIDAFVGSLKANIKDLGTQADSIKTKLKDLQSVPIGKQDFEGIKNLNTELSKTESAIQFLTQLTDNLSELPKSFNQSTDSAGRLSLQLRAMKDELAKMKEEGKDSTPEFAAKLEDASKLEHAIHNVNKELELQSSNVAGVEALKEGFRGLIGGAEAFAGAVGLMTDDAEQAEVITKNLIALQSILNGVEEVGAILDKNSALNVYLLGLQRKFASAATVEQTVSTEVLAGAQAEGVVATEAATVAQEGLNVAMLANPVGIILGSVVALYAAYEILSNTVFKASSAERQREAALQALSEAEEKAADKQGEEISNLNVLIETAQNKILTDEQRGKAISELRSQYPEYLSNLSLENIYTKQASEAIEKQTELIKARALEEAAQQVYVEAVKEQIKKQNELNETLRTGGGFWKTLWATIKTGGTVSPDVVVLNDKIEEVDESADKANGAFETFKQTQVDLAAKMGNTTGAINDQGAAWSDFGKQVGAAQNALTGILTQGNTSLQKALSSVHKPFDKKEFEDEKKRITELYQYEIDKTKEGTAANLKARINMAKALNAYEKTNIKLFNPDGSVVSEKQDKTANAEALAIQGKFAEQMTNLNEELTDKALKNATAGANALVLLLQAAGQQGSEKYFQAQENAIRKAAAEQIAQAKDNAGQVREIQAKLAVDLEELDKARQKQQLENEKSITQTRLNLVRAGSQDELNLRLHMIDIDAQEELLQAGKNQDKINEITSNAEKQKAELRKKFAIEVAETETNIRIAEIERQLAAVRDGSDEELNLKKQLVDQKADLDVQEKRKQIKNEALLAAEIGKIYAQTIRDKKKLEDEFVNDLLQRQFHLLDTQQASSNTDNDFIINDPRSTNTEKATAQMNKLRDEGFNLKEKINAINNQIASNRGDITSLSAQLDELHNKQQQNTNDQKLQGLKLLTAQLEDIEDGSARIASTFKELGSAVSGFNSDLGKSISSLGQMAGNVASLAKGFKDFKDAGKDTSKQLAASADIATAVINAINEIFADIKASKQAKVSAEQQMQDFNTKLITGELAYQALLRQRQREQVLINKLTLDGLAAQKKLLEQQKTDTLSQFQDVLKQLQSQSFTSSLSEKEKINWASITKGLAGIFSQKSTSIKDVLESLAGKNFDQLEELFMKGQLTGQAAALFQELQKLKQEGLDIDQQLNDLKEKTAQIFTGTTADSLRDSLADMFRDGKTSAADFAQFFKDAMRNAALSVFEFKFLEPKIKDFFDQFSAAAESGDTLDSTEIGQLQSKFNQYMKQASKEFEDLQKVTGINFNSNGSSPNALVGQFRSLTEDTGNVLVGQFNGQRLATLELVDLQRSAMNIYSNIEANTANTVLELRSVQQTMVNFFRTEGVKMK